MAKRIKSIAEAIGIIEKEVERMSGASLGKMGEEKTVEEKPAEEISKYCIECDAPVYYYKAKFCRLCANEFYNEIATANEGDGRNE